MLNIENIGMELGGRWLLRNASYQILPGEKIGLVGRNGAGKSTLLRLLTGQLDPTEGRVNKSSKLKLAFFNQDLLSFETDEPIHEVVRQAFAPLLKMGEEIEMLMSRMEAGEGGEELWNDLAEKSELFEKRGGSLVDAKVHGMLTGLGFSKEEQYMSYKTFSGGWRMRVLLAKMLLEEPDVLLLDEPTNHLDLPSIEWLEDYIRNYKGSVVMVSHDRFFLDRMAEKVLEISLGKLHVYAGNYSFYLTEKIARVEQHKRAYENQQKYIAQQEAFITRFKAKATKARQAQSKMKQLDKLVRIAEPEIESFKLKIRFGFARPSGKEVSIIEKLSKSFGEKHILDTTSATVMRGDKIGLIGANGMGKSTLLRIIAERESYQGTCRVGHNVLPAFYAQHQLEALRMDNSVYEETAAGVGGKTETYIRGVLGSFMFSGEDIEKRINVLSGGEKSRVALAKTLLSEANFLLLDEPTNHLDFGSIKVLIQALQEYEGTYLLVSHDRWFIEQVVNKIWYIEDRKIKVYPGSLNEWQVWKQERAERETAKPASKISKVASKIQEPQNTPTVEASRSSKNRIKKLQRQLVEVEAQIEKLEAEKAVIVTEMGKPEVASDYSKLAEVQAQHKAVVDKLNEATELWETVGMELEEMGV